MTSPVDTSVKFIHSTQSGAPVLNGVAGSGISLLDAFLVTGWGLQTTTSLVVSGGVATLSFGSTFPAVVDSVIQVAGSSIADLNGEQKVTAIGSGTVSFATAAADGVASGTITAKMAPAGWAKVFTGTNKAVYKPSNPMSNGMYLRVDDTGATTMRVRGHEQMTDVDTGIGLFPTDAQISGGGFWDKSATAQAAANGYFLAADSRTLLIHLCPYQYANAAYIAGNTHGFGDLITSRAAGDAFATFLNASPAFTGTGGTAYALDLTANSSCALPRDYTGLGGSVMRPRAPLTGALNATSGVDGTLGAFPSYVDGRLLLSRVLVTQGSLTPPRGVIPGLYYVPQSGLGPSFPRGSRVPGAAGLAGRTLFAVNNAGGATSLAASSASMGASFIDITGPWR